MKLKVVKCAHSIRAGTKEMTTVTSETHEMEFKDKILKIVQRKTGLVTYTSIYNMIWWVKAD